MEIGRLAMQFQCSMMALVLISACPLGALAQSGHPHPTTAQPQELTPAQGTLLKVVRDNTERFKDVSVAEAEGYSLLFGCVSGPDRGAMGLHFINMELVGKGTIDPAQPQIILYEPAEDGRLKLTGADFLVDAQQWDGDKTHKPGPPELMGQLFHYFESSNRFGLPAFYTLHVWAWKENPNGAFVNWHPKVSCQAFAGQ